MEPDFYYTTVGYKKTALFYFLRPQGFLWRKRISNSKIFCTELFGCVECYKESIGHSSSWTWIGFFGMSHGGQCHVFSKRWRGHENPGIRCWVNWPSYEGVSINNQPIPFPMDRDGHVFMLLFNICFIHGYFVCLFWVFTAQSTQWGHVERGQFT